jgi:hypothetical protein
MAAFDGLTSAAGDITNKNFLSAMSELSWMFVEDGDFADFAARCLGAKSCLQTNYS